MLIRPFLEWFTLAEADDRVEAAEALCEAYRDGHLSIEDPRDTEAALTLLLDDRSPRVRQAVARFFAEEPRAPRHLIIALAHDQPEIAVPVLMRSPVLTDADLIDCASLGDIHAQIAIASRLAPSRAVSSALAEIGCVEALCALVRNAGSDITPRSFARMAERMGDDLALRTLMLEREDLPLVIRHALVIKVSEYLVRLICDGQWMPRQRAERLLSDARQSATVLLISAAAPDEALELVDDMRSRGQLTPSLLLRALLSREIALFETALSVLSGLPMKRVAAVLGARHGAGFAALYRRAKMPAALMTTFRAAVAGVLREGTAREHGEEPRLSRAVISEALLACAADAGSEESAIMALLRRLEAEAARDEARRVSAIILGGAQALSFDGFGAGPTLVVRDDSASALVIPADDVSACIDFAAIEQELVSFAAAAGGEPLDEMARDERFSEAGIDEDAFDEAILELSPSDVASGSLQAEPDDVSADAGDAFDELKLIRAEVFVEDAGHWAGEERKLAA